MRNNALWSWASLCGAQVSSDGLPLQQMILSLATNPFVSYLIIQWQKAEDYPIRHGVGFTACMSAEQRIQVAESRT